MKDDSIEESIEQRATEWFVRHREGDLTPQEQKNYMLWLRASPRHVEAYLSLIGLTARLPEALSGLGVDAEALAQTVRQSPGAAEQALFVGRRTITGLPAARGHRRFAWAAVVVAALAGAIYWSAPQTPASRTVFVPAGQQRVMTLPDGSTAHINADTRIVLRYSDAQRLIELPDGQALFSVVHDPRRPFIVRSGGTDVVAVGTQFDVYRRASHMQVTVVEGKIEILGAKAGEEVTRVAAGEQVRIEDSSRPTRPAAVDVRTATAWSRKEVSFAAQRLQDVAAQFNRYAGANITIEDPLLRDYRVSGVFQAYDVDSFIAYLQQFDGIAVERRGESVRVSSKNR